MVPNGTKPDPATPAPVTGLQPGTTSGNPGNSGTSGTGGTSGTSGTSGGRPRPAGQGRAGLPLGDVLADAQKQLHAAHKTEYAKTTPADRAAFAKKLLSEADQHPLTSPARYARLTEARDMAATAGAVDTALTAADLISKTFAVDALPSRLDLIARLARSAASARDREDLAKACLATMDEAQLAGKYELAGKLAGAAEMSADRLAPACWRGSSAGGRRGRGP